MNKKMSPTMVGGFVLGALALAVAGIITFGSGKMFAKTYEFVMFFDSSVNGLKIGAPVKVRGVEIGTVNEILLTLNAEEVRGTNQTGAAESRQAQSARWNPRIPVIVEIDLKKITSRGNTGRALFDPQAFQLAIERGLRGRLEAESLVTGLLYIDLDFYPGTPVNYFAPPGTKYKEVPTIPTELEEVQTDVKNFMAKLQEVELAKMIHTFTRTAEAAVRLLEAPEIKSALRSIDTTVKSIDTLVRNVDREVGPVAKELRAALRGVGEAATTIKKLADNVDGQVQPVARSVREAAEQGKKTLAAADGLIAENSPLNHDLTAALAELSNAARAVGDLAKYLERNPNALLYGKR